MKLREQLIRVVSSLMLIVFFAGVMPKEYLHELVFDHHDDVHPLYKAGEVVITPEHHHCSFVGFVFAPFLTSEKIFLTFSKEYPVYTKYLQPEYEEAYTAVSFVVSLRGPPGC